VESLPLRVALVYNQKKEDGTQQSGTDASTEPPSLTPSENLSITPLTASLQSSPAASDLYAEWDSRETIEAVKLALEEIHTVTMVEADVEAYAKLVDARPDIVFNIAEGLHGISREAQIPAMLEFLQIPYSGSDPLTLATCLDKSRCKEVLSYHHIATPKFAVVARRADIDKVHLRYPSIVKPLHEGSSKGIANTSLVNSAVELEREVVRVLESYHQPALVEEFLPGREFTVAMLGNGSDVQILPIVEIKFDSLPQGVNPIYSYEAKWVWDTTEKPLDIYECPANISPNLKTVIEAVCRRAFSVLRCRDWCRIDLRLDLKGEPHIIELNPLPGILPDPRDNSCFPKAARSADLSYNRMLQTVLYHAAMRYGLTGSATPAQT
jgi:D-alanine-D-alanine ligase